jgi:hypothetical protein
MRLAGKVALVTGAARGSGRGRSSVHIGSIRAAKTGQSIFVDGGWQGK